MARVKKSQTKSSIVISVLVHALIIGAVFFWAAKSGIIPDEIVRVIGLAPKKKEEPKKPEPKPEPKPTKQDVKEAANPPPDQNPAPPPSLTVRAANPNALPGKGNSPFTAEARQPGAAPAPVIQPQTSGNGKPGGTGTGAPAPKPSATTLPPSLFSKEATAASTVESVLAERKNSVVVQDAISSEQIRRTGATDAGQIVSRVAGASVVDGGKTVVVRGLSDRYTSATLNGGDIPTADPYRKSVQLDLFPAAMIDRVVVSKTFTPDQPGGFTGGSVNIVTKSFPSQFLFNATVGSSFNTQASFNDNFYTYNGGGLDWLGMDDGTRAIPGQLADPNTPIPSPPRNAIRGETAQQYIDRLNAANTLANFTSLLGPTQFAPVSRTSPMNNDFSISIGDTVRLADKPFGYFASVSYRREFNFYEDAVSDRYTASLEPRRTMADTRGVADVAWSGVINLAYQLHPDHEIGFNFLYNQNSDDEARRQKGTDFTTGHPELISDLSTLHFTERNLASYQLRGKHNFIELGGTKIDWLASFANTSQNEPDLRYFNYFHNADGTIFDFNNALPQPQRPTRYWRFLNEDNMNLKLDTSVPLMFLHGLEGEFKFGGYYSDSQRDFNERTLTYRSQTSDAGWTDPLDPNTYLNPDVFGYDTFINPRGQTNFLFDRYIVSEYGNSFYSGQQRVTAGYLMATVPLNDQVKLVGGARLEATDLSIQSFNPVLGLTNSALKQTDLLPAASLIWAWTSKMNLRLSYSQTLARPTYREIASVRTYDLTGDEILEGNPNLRITSAENFDLRWEWFPRAGEVLAFSAFYKNLTDPIEKYSQTISGDIVTYVNRDSAKVYGVEFEARKSFDFLDPLLRYFSFGVNLALIGSEVSLTDAELFNKRQLDPKFPATRPLYDQSPYVANMDFTYDNPRSGTTASLSVNLAGERIYLATGAGPDIYEHPPAMIDFVFSKRLTKNMRLKFTAKNLLDPPFQRTYGSKPDNFAYSSYKKGRQFGLALSYDF